MGDTLAQGERSQVPVNRWVEPQETSPISLPYSKKKEPWQPSPSEQTSGQWLAGRQAERKKAAQSAQGTPPMIVAQKTPNVEGTWQTGNVVIIYKETPPGHFGMTWSEIANHLEYPMRVLRRDAKGNEITFPIYNDTNLDKTLKAGDKIQYLVPPGQTAKQDQKNQPMPYTDKLGKALQMVPGLLAGDAKALFQKLTSDPAFVAVLVGAGAVFVGLQFTPVGPALDTAFFLAFGLKAGYEVLQFFHQAYQAKDANDPKLKEAAESFKNAIEDGGGAALSGMAGGFKTLGGLLNKLKGGKQAEQAVQMFSQLKPQQIQQFEQAITLRNAGKSKEANAISSQLESTLGKENFQTIEQYIQARMGRKTVSEIKKQTPRVGSQIDDKKFDYLFGRATGRQHNLARTNQNALEMKRLGIPDTPEGHAMLRSHLDNVVQENSNIIRAFNNEWGSFEVRESLFAGLSGKFSNFESTWQVLPDGTRRFSTLIPRGGGGK